MLPTNLLPFSARRILAGWAFLGFGLMVCADDAVPTAFPNNRYDLVRARSPFATATAEAPPVAPQASFAANWFVSGVARLGDDYYVTVKSRDRSSQFSLFGGEEVHGVTLASVTWSDAIGKSTIVLRKGTETAKLEFNEEEIRAAPAAQPTAGTPLPGSKPAPGVVAPAPAARPLPLPIQPAPNQGAAPPPAGVRRRMQVIQPPQ